MLVVSESSFQTLFPHPLPPQHFIPYSGVWETSVIPTALAWQSHTEVKVHCWPAIRSNLNDSDSNDSTVIRWLCQLGRARKEQSGLFLSQSWCVTLGKSLCCFSFSSRKRLERYNSSGVTAAAVSYCD